MAERSNFIILYNGREGSSAIVSMLSAQKSVHVPLFEDLDRYTFSVTNPDDQVSVVMDQVFRTGQFPIKRSHFWLYPSEWQPGDVIGFKFRPNIPAEELANVLRANNARVFVLSRRDFMELLSSNYVNVRWSENAVAENNQFPQFKISQMNEKDRAVALKEFDNLRMPVNLASFRTISRKLVRSRSRFVGIARELSRLGIEVIPIYYEDFVRDRKKFIQSILTALGFPDDWPVKDQTKLVKVMQTPARKKLRGLAWAFGRLLVQPDRIRYERELSKLEALRRKQ